MNSPPASSQAAIARQAREHFVAHMEGVLRPLADAIRGRLTDLMYEGGGARDGQERRDAVLQFERSRQQWLANTVAAWRKALLPPTTTTRVRLQASNLSLIGDEVVENKILASRIALVIADKSNWELNDLKARMHHLEGEELAGHDVLRAEVVVQLMVEQWMAAGLQRSVWNMVHELIQKQMADWMEAAYKATNKFLVDRGVMPDIDLDGRAIKKAPDSSLGALAAARARATSGFGTSIGLGAAALEEETRMLTSSTPLERAKMRATGVLGQLKRLLLEKAGFDPNQAAVPPSPALAYELGRQTELLTQIATQLAASSGEVVVYDDDAVDRIAGDLRQRTGELKKKAGTQSEKATIEIVALMFQSILAEERIPAAVRVWFARLQMPVLRVALAEPEFFSTLQHPARQLIDRMGSCVLGFNAAAIGGSALEIEIKRVVQVIEQYPETGRRVFQLVYDEFQKFLSKFLTEKVDTQKLVSVAQQMEQKEAMAIQYTIELRKMLADIPVREGIREFLFKVWAEVLAVAAVKHGPQHQQTVMLKQSAADLVWSASAKPNRAERAKVIQELPGLLVRLRGGMTLLGLQQADQETHIKVISDTLADAFMSKTESIPQQQIDAMSKRLANLEDFIADDPEMELELDQDALEMMLGIDASMIEVVTDGGSQPSDAMLAWAAELQQGNWFTLDHNRTLHQVQYVWRSDRGQLHLFASAEGRSFLVQMKRLASYLQAGLLVPAEEEALTVRATRDALAKLNASPDRLLT